MRTPLVARPVRAPAVIAHDRVPSRVMRDPARRGSFAIFLSLDRDDCLPGVLFRVGVATVDDLHLILLCRRPGWAAIASVSQSPPSRAIRTEILGHAELAYLPIPESILFLFRFELDLRPAPVAFDGSTFPEDGFPGIGRSHGDGMEDRVTFANAITVWRRQEIPIPRRTSSPVAVIAV